MIHSGLDGLAAHGIYVRAVGPMPQWRHPFAKRDQRVGAQQGGPRVAVRITTGRGLLRMVLKYEPWNEVQATLEKRPLSGPGQDLIIWRVAPAHPLARSAGSPLGA